MRKFKEDIKGKNSDLIKSFIELKNFRKDYEAWVPYIHHGIAGFIDLVIESKSEISIFKFVEKAKKIERAVKSLKLESTIYPKTREISSKKVKSYLILLDNRKNRKAVISQYSLLGNQPFKILFLDRENERIESISELKDTLPRLFKTKNMRLDDGALKKLISKPNHHEIEEAILKCGDSLNLITVDLIEKIDNYLKRNEEIPEDFISVGNSGKRGEESYTGGTKKSQVEGQNGVKEIGDESV